MKRIEGCGHELERMIEYANEGACPICLLATVLQYKSERDALAGALDWYAAGVNHEEPAPSPESPFAVRNAPVEEDKGERARAALAVVRR